MKRGEAWLGIVDVIVIMLIALLFIFFFFFIRFVSSDHEEIDDFRLRFSCDELAMDFLQTVYEGKPVYEHLILDTDNISDHVTTANICVGLRRSDDSVSLYGSNCPYVQTDLSQFGDVYTYIGGHTFAFYYSEFKKC